MTLQPTTLEAHMSNTNLTARAILEARLGRPLGPIATMPQDLRRALLGLAKELIKARA